ncbi:MAG: hypothetical protein AAF480_08670 [Actinomycetota bacterium]
MKKRIVPTMLATALLLAACGGDDSDVESADDTTEAAEETTTDEAAEETAAQTADDVAADASEVAVEGEADAEATSDETTAGDDDAATATAAGTPMTLNGFRYCEILMSVPGEDGGLVTEVWGTPGVDPCDQEDWEALEPDTIAADNSATSIHMNGPRYFTIDGTVDTGTVEGGVGTAAGGEAVTRDFGDISMSLLATVDGDDVELVFYTPSLVVRTTTWAFQAGTELYELTDPEGNVYTMQSYALFEDPTLTPADLPTLGERLEMPEGWSFSTRVAEEDFVVALAPDGALVVNDELGNSYQRNG